MKLVFWRYSPLATKITFLSLFVIIVILFISFHRIIRCDEQAQNRLVETSDGSVIPKFNKDLKVVSYSDLSKKCSYVNDKIECPDVRTSGETMLRQVQLAIMRMLTILDLICKKHSINYWMMSGTLLGAYRDGITIPWDNDADIGIIYEDYLKLIQALKADLPEDIFFQNGDDELSYKKNKKVEAKLRDRNSCYGHCMRTGCQFHDGLQVDIFVFKRQQNNPNEILSFPQERFKLNTDDIFPLTNMKLENIEFYAPKNTQKILAQFFGKDFMTPVNNKCPEYGFIAIPWYSCEFIENLPPVKKRKVLEDSMVHDSYFFWFFG